MKRHCKGAEDGFLKTHISPASLCRLTIDMHCDLVAACQTLITHSMMCSPLYSISLCPPSDK